MRPDPSDYSPGMAAYVGNVPEDDVLAALEKQREETTKLLSGLDEEKAGFRYEPGKWSIREVVGHMTDCERVFAYRAMAIARGEQQSLPGFDEKVYEGNAGHDAVPLQQLVNSYLVVRAATILLFNQMPQDAWDRRGTANGKPATPRALAYATVGHERHHVKILRERYLSK